MQWKVASVYYLNVAPVCEDCCASVAPFQLCENFTGHRWVSDLFCLISSGVVIGQDMRIK